MVLVHPEAHAPPSEGAPEATTAEGSESHEAGLSLSSGFATGSPWPTLDIQPFPSRDGLLVKIQPPREPADPALDHVPCDIVLVIDVSFSMSSHAPIPGESKERTGLTVLDLVKHAAKAIVQTLNEKDRLGIVTFSTAAKVTMTTQPYLNVNTRNYRSSRGS
jgi:hypothetical protein